VTGPGHRISSFSRDAATILVFALAPAAGVGIARFAYSLLLPDMRASLGWSYSAAGFMNTINAVGYLVGAGIAAGAIRRVGQFSAIFFGTLACVIALAVSAMTGNFVVLSLARLAAGIGAAVAFVGGGVAAAQLSQHHPRRAAFLLSLYYVGPGLGIFISGLGTPLLLERLGPGSWWIAWGALAALTAILTLALLLVQRKEVASPATAAAAEHAPLMPMTAILAGYVLFSVGSIAYLTFMIAWLRDAGAGGLAQSAFWSLLGFGGICAPLLWSWAIAVLTGGRGVAAMATVTLAATLTALLIDHRILQLASAFVFGSAFFAVVTATTAFVRRNFPPTAWASGVGAMTVAFGLGQTLGPVLSGAISDASGNLSLGLLISAVIIAAGAIVAAVQSELARV
jgi:predicted MFS family arabinose efflux permease